MWLVFSVTSHLNIVYKTKKGWIRIATAGALRGVTRQAIYDRIKAGNIPHRDILVIDGVMFLRESAVLELNIKQQGEQEKKP